ncbi:peptide ABC transporter substrate-binding protein [Paenibacillus sp. JTLBN-2024]|uniref:Oligopeptide-binding protein OppA n=1 Tax=Paenibacillus cookii TaxID=157839 RepID=A0ABQ4LQL4_9BACL|nr:peptide ABC transporter substrate-binding protein [Paenibacillus cookii]GIO65554.1 oligopeptide-binding protein OppA [Paenibacillus cookii]HWO54589.1 peptide ABC transporter substrate-binding protein [Paenibacillus cookii]
MRRKTLLTLLTMLLVVGTVLAGCGSKNAGGGSKENASAAKDQILHMNLSAEPPTFDPAQAQDSQAHTVLNMMYEGLVRLDENSKPVPGVAEKWDISSDGLKYVFHLRKDAKWSNGDPVTAKDFVFAWQRVLDPNTTPAPPYAYQLYYIKGAEEYNNKKMTDFSQVGVKATDDHTLEVTLKNPTPYFLGLTSFYTFYPVHQSVKDNPKWAADPKTMISNGPFTLTTWTTGQKIEVSKNANYWDNKDIKLNKITMSLSNSGATELSSYRSGQLDYAGMPNGEIPTDQMPAVKKQLQNELNLKPIGSVYYYQFNVTAKPFDNAKIRKAFAMAISRQEIVDKVTQSEEKPAFGFVPPGIAGEKEEFRTEHKDDYFTENMDEAKKLLQEGMKEEGYTTLPPVTLIYNSSEKHKKIALAVADMWKKNLGVTVQTENQEWGVFLKNRRSLNYQIARAGWSPDYNDPMTFFDLWTSKSGNNDIGFKNKEYDALVSDALASSDNAKRMDDFVKAEKLLIQDQQVLLPIYYYTNVALIKPNLKGVIIDYAGGVDFTRAYFE